MKFDQIIKSQHTKLFQMMVSVSNFELFQRKFEQLIILNQFSFEILNHTYCTE